MILLYETEAQVEVKHGDQPPWRTALQQSVIRQQVSVNPLYSKLPSGSLSVIQRCLLSLTHSELRKKPSLRTNRSLSKGSVSDPCGRAPASHGYLTWCYASHYITASQWPLLAVMITDLLLQWALQRSFWARINEGSADSVSPPLRVWYTSWFSYDKDKHGPCTSGSCLGMDDACPIWYGSSDINFYD